MIAAAVLLFALLLLALVARSCGPDRVEGHAYAIPAAGDRIVVEVLNGSGRPGLARLGSRRLRRLGLDVVYFGNADTRTDTTRVILRRGDPGQAERVRGALGAGRIIVQRDTLRRVDVSVVLGNDFVPDEDGRP